ncbi:FMN-binding protein [Reichenbachiella sp. MALMAid0571]|uniref:FMN-binding protein n=1 Tax=Reichenbachiella sp. MALMAid0571 TaxID=3143939 RepID=UPI0032DE8DBA
MKYLFFCVGILFISAFAMQDVKFPKSALKKIDRSITNTWGVEEYNKSPISLSGIDFELTGLENVNVIEGTDSEPLGYMVLSKGRGKYDYFDLMVLYDKELKIVASEVLVYREDYGGEIGSGRWLKQFVGKNITSEFKLSNDVQGISGATISVRSATQEFKRLTRLMEQLKNQNKLNI